MDLTEEEHFDIVRRKTAYLFAGCARIGGMLGPTTREQQEALWDYGLNIGMAFQIVDDLLDFTGEEVALGKPVGGDLREGKMTLPVIHLRERGDARAGALLRKVVESRDVTLEEWREIRSAAGAVALDRLRALEGVRVRRAREEGAVRVPALGRARRADVPARLRHFARSVVIQIQMQNANQHVCILTFAF